MAASTYYLTWPDRVTTLFVVDRPPQGPARIRVAGRRERIEAMLREKPLPTEDAEIRRLFAKLGTSVKKLSDSR